MLSGSRIFEEFLSKVVPDLSLDSLDYEINKLVIKDSGLGKLHNVYFRFHSCKARASGFVSASL